MNEDYIDKETNGLTHLLWRNTCAEDYHSEMVIISYDLIYEKIFNENLPIATNMVKKWREFIYLIFQS